MNCGMNSSNGVPATTARIATCIPSRAKSIVPVLPAMYFPPNSLLGSTSGGDKFYAVETNVGTELVPTDVIGIDDEV